MAHEPTRFFTGPFRERLHRQITGTVIPTNPTWNDEDAPLYMANNPKDKFHFL
jgi:hypothetical protein